MRPIYYFLIAASCCLLYTCTSDSASSGKASGEVDMNAPLLEDVNGANYPGASAPSLILRVGGGEVASGSEICLPFKAYDFNNMLGFQYTIRWDSTLLQFERVEDFGLPGYGPPDFGTKFISKGVLASLWSDPQVQPKTLPSGHKLFDLCFTALGKAGDKAVVRLANGPTPFEFINGDMARYRLKYANGEVVIK